MSTAITNRQRFVNACHCRPNERPPHVADARAGRPCRNIASSGDVPSCSFCQTPDLAVEVTLQPVRRFGFDAAILFSDILVIPEGDGAGISLQRKPAA